MSGGIMVYGIGAIGAQAAGRLHSAGHDVIAVEPWPAQREAVARDGLRIANLDGSIERHRPPVLAPEELSGRAELCLLAVKSYDTEAALERVLPHLAADAPLVSLQNSINEERIASRAGAARVLGGVVLVNAVLLQPGLVTATASVSRAAAGVRLPGLYVGEYLRPPGALARRVAALLDAVWPAEVIDDLMHERWTKLLTNTALNPVSGIGGLRSAEMLADAAARRAIAQIAAEVLRVAAAEGHPFERVMGDFSARQVLDGAAGRSDAFERGLAERASRVSADAATSLLQDVLRGRRTEVDYFSGLVTSKGRAHGVATPWCEAATAMVHEIEQGRRAPSAANLEELLRRAAACR
ncbi:MAG TPA: ketopantoate reductase family protein [Burkholderiales bacterium]|nr:ketopantoate reductase family protein [Burkholderiales bacterium]